MRSDEPTFGPGLVGDIARFVWQAAPFPNEQIAYAAAFYLMAGICGRSYTCDGAGLNIYALVLGATGIGKEAVSDGISKLMMPVEAKNDKARALQGPGEIRSDAALFRTFDRLGTNPVMRCHFGEMGLLLKAISSPKASPHIAALERILLQLYGKSELGSHFDAAAYADAENNTKRLYRPTLTIIGDSTPETFDRELDAAMATKGVLPRFIIWTASGPRPAINRERLYEPSSRLVEALGALVAKVFYHADEGSTCEVAYTQAARTYAHALSDETNRLWNAAVSDVDKSLWSRVALNVVKLAALIAVGCNYERPVIERSYLEWAERHVFGQVRTLIGKFDTGQVGDQSNNEARQQSEVLRVIRDYYMTRHEDFPRSYAVRADWHSQRVVPYSYLSQRLINLPAFAGAATASLKRTIETLMQYEEIAEVNHEDKRTKFGGTRQRLFVATKLHRLFPDTS